MNDELGSGGSFIKILFWHLPEGTEANNENISQELVWSQNLNLETPEYEAGLWSSVTVLIMWI